MVFTTKDVVQQLDSLERRQISHGLGPCYRGKAPSLRIVASLVLVLLLVVVVVVVKVVVEVS